MELIQKWAEVHHGLVRRRDAADLGVTRSQFDSEVRRGYLERVAEGVYRIRGSVPTWRQRLLGAVWAAGADAAASHRSAAALSPLPGFPPGPIEVVRPHHSGRRRPVGRVRETSFLPAHHVSSIDGIPVTSAARTIFDLCGVVRPERADRAVENGLAAGLTTYAGLATVLAECARPGRAGVTVLRELLARRGDGYVPTESELERLVVAVLEAAGLPLPERQVVLGNAETQIGRVDFLYRAACLVIEADGSQHGGWLASQADERRDAMLRAAGFEVIRVHWRMLIDEPELFVAAVRRALQDRSGRLPA